MRHGVGESLDHAARKPERSARMAEGGTIAFGEFRLDLASEMLARDGVPVPLTPKAYRLLRHFLAHPDVMLSKDDLLDAVWPGVAVGDAVLKVCVGELRRALGDATTTPRYIATAHRRGYRFIALVHDAADGEGEARVPDVAPRRVPGIVGRGAALAQLDDAMGAARDERRQIVFVTGEAGIGKTTLVDAFLDGLDPAIGRARGQCLEHYGAGEAYLPWLDALGRLCRDPRHGDAVCKQLADTAPSWMTSIPGVERGAARGTTAPSRTRMLLELAESLEALTATVPVVLVLEDLHWSDPSTLDVLALLAHRPEPARLLVIATYRPVDLVVRSHPLRGLKLDLELRGKARELALEFLTERDVADYLALRLATARVPAGLDTLVHQRTDGNPLFVSHVVDFLLAHGWLREADGAWTFEADPCAAADLVPDTLRQMIAATIADLDPETQRVLDAASVVGVAPTAAAVAAALDAPVPTVEDTLIDLARRGQLVTAAGIDLWPDGTRTARFAFIHALHQNVVQRRLAPERRALLHARVGRRLEAAFRDDVGAIAAELAQHFRMAGDHPRAAVHLRHAGERAITRHAYREGIEHLEHALEALEHLPADDARTAAELDVRMRLGPALMIVHGFAAAPVERCYARARALCTGAGTTPARSRALRGLGIFALTRGELLDARVLAEESLADAERGDTPNGRGKAHVTLGTILYYLGELAAATTHLERGRRLLGRAPERPVRSAGQAPVVNCLAFLAMTRWFRGQPDTALRLAEEARAVADALDHPLSRLWAAHVTALLHHLRGEPERAATVAEIAIRVAAELGLRQWIAWGNFFLGWIATLEGRTDAGLSGMRTGLEEYRATGAELGRVYLTATLAEAHARAGRADAAQALLDDALALGTARSERYFTAELHRLRAGLLADRAAAEAELRQAVTLASRQGNLGLALRAATDLATLLSGEAGRRVLAPLSRRIREGADTADVRAARATLAALDTAVTRRRRT
jgi:DNA-binding winged helix-turn-helix (wHTH) protein/tetratricopeptide (TPR) repeat protein